MTKRFLHPFAYQLAALGIANLSLLVLPPGDAVRVVGALILLLLPGLAWADVVWVDAPRRLRWVVGLGLSYVLIICVTLLLHYLPGPVAMWAEVVALDGLAVLAAVIGAARAHHRPLLPALAGVDSAPTRPIDGAAWCIQDHWRDVAPAVSLQPATAGHTVGRSTPPRTSGPGGIAAVALPLVMIVAAGIFFRLAWLGYSEFQGDEALAMISAAGALEGHEDALFLRGKGPGEVLLPVALWRLTGTLDEGAARLPFAVAGALLPLVGFVLAASLFDGRRSGLTTGLAAAAFLALNGFMVAFARIVQYQSLVVLMSGLALLCAWRWRRDTRARWLVACGLFLGTGLLAHYDALLVVPAVVYAVGSALVKTERPAVPRRVTAVLAGGVALLVVAGLFYVPYLLDPQAARTGGYLGDRIGGQLIKNNLDSFQQLNIFYTSFYYYAPTGMLVLAYLAWAGRRARGVCRLPGASIWLPVLLALAVLGVAIWPRALHTPAIDLAGLPFVLLLLAALLSTALDDARRTVVLWLAVPFLGYNFGVALPLTHIYTVVPAWTLLAGLVVAAVGQRVAMRRSLSWLAAVGALIGVALCAGYLGLAYLRQHVEFRQDWPSSHPPLYWTPYADPPPTGFFGFPHRTGWKAVGALYSEGRLEGDYGSNEEPDITAWYTRGAARACDPQPAYYFIADGLVDPSPVDMEAITAHYDVAGAVRLPNGKGLTIYQARPPREQRAGPAEVAATGDLGPLDRATLEAAFDHSATPDAFARSGRGGQAIDANLGGLVRLVGYDVDTQRARPGARLAVTLYWQTLQPLADDYHAFVHLEADQIWGQADGRPVCWTYPTTDWRPGQVIADHHALAIRPDTPPGEYPLLVGMYSPVDGRRLDVLDAAGKPVANAVSLGVVPVQ